MLLLLAWALLTGHRALTWGSEEQLWASAVALTPTKPRPLVNLGRQREFDGDFAGAMFYYRAGLAAAYQPHLSALQRRTIKATVETNVAHLLMSGGQTARAMHILDGIISEWPEFPYSHFNKGAVFRHLGACRDAAYEYALAFAGDPALPRPEPCVERRGE